MTIACFAAFREKLCLRFFAQRFGRVLHTMSVVLPDAVFDEANLQEHRRADLRLARRIRAFRPGPVAHVTDRQLMEIVRQARGAARRLGIVQDRLVARFVMVDALIAPKFYEQRNVIEHFQRASGSPDARIGDLFQLMKLTLRAYGRDSEVWW